MVRGCIIRIDVDSTHDGCSLIAFRVLKSPVEQVNLDHYLTGIFTYSQHAFAWHQVIATRPWWPLSQQFGRRRC